MQFWAGVVSRLDCASKQPSAQCSERTSPARGLTRSSRSALAHRHQIFTSAGLLNQSQKTLRVNPDSDQIFSRETIQLTCESEWRVKRTRTGSDQVQSYSGLYWCESAAGGRSPQRLLTVTDRNLILVSPALPVQTGSDITLRCRRRRGSGLSPVLLKDGEEVHKGLEDYSFTVSKEHEGEYICKDTTEESEKRRLQVTDPPPTTAATTLSFTSLFPSPSPSPPFWLMWVLRPLLVFSPYGVCTVLLVQVYRGQRRSGTRPRLVSMETGQQEEDDYDDVVAAEVTTEHSF
ncbi:hypothetical protein WMY93_014037 [Mugilogobius chulae]|uniref:Ig-like domain-containing protein n=1 Tax=Mugilogobius chulae TaxID=88201 RepID=A0AAW0NY43_9GOBI